MDVHGTYTVHGAHKNETLLPKPGSCTLFGARANPSSLDVASLGPNGFFFRAGLPHSDKLHGDGHGPERAWMVLDGGASHDRATGPVDWGEKRPQKLITAAHLLYGCALVDVILTVVIQRVATCSFFAGTGGPA